MPDCKESAASSLCWKSTMNFTAVLSETRIELVPEDFLVARLGWGEMVLIGVRDWKLIGAPSSDSSPVLTSRKLWL